MITSLSSNRIATGTPQRAGGAPRGRFDSATPALSDRVELGRATGPADAPPPAVASAPPPAATASVGTRVLAGLGLGLVALSLAGCNFETGAPQPPANQEQGQSTAATLTARLEELKAQPDQTGYRQMQEASYYQRVLRAISQETDPAAKELTELAQKGVEAFDFKGSPAEQRETMHDVLSTIAQGERQEGLVSRYRDVAGAAVKIGEYFNTNSQNASGGLVAQVKAAGYEQALQKMLDYLPTVPDQVKHQTGLDPAMVRNYTEGLSATTRVALEAGKEFNDVGLQAVLYEGTVNELYTRVKSDGEFLGGQFKQILDLAMQLKSRFGG